MPQTPTTSPPTSPQLPRLRASSPESHHDSWSPQQSPPRSPALSSTATADEEFTSSPLLPPLALPSLPRRAAQFLRTPPPNRDTNNNSQYVTASWGSPYSPRTRAQLHPPSVSSESSGSPVHQLQIETPFLRTAPPTLLPGEEDQSRVSATVLANRARRPTRGLTEDWIRQHTAGDLHSEAAHWLSDGSGEGETSSLSGSISGGEAPWTEEKDFQTPRASFGQSQAVRRDPRRYPRTRSSNETLKQAHVARADQQRVIMASPDVDKVVPDGASEHTVADSITESVPTPSTPKGSIRSGLNGTVGGDRPRVNFDLPQTPPHVRKEKALPATPRLKKKVPWKGKNIMILLPRDEKRGQPGSAVIPLTKTETDNMMRSWAELGYNTQGFDLNPSNQFLGQTNLSRSRDSWPTAEDMRQERSQRKFTVLLPDLNKWKDHVNELQEAKLRALGVSFGDEDPPLPSASPAPLSRQPSVTHYPPLPFSPPLPTGSAASGQQFPFQFPVGIGSGTQSPGIPSAVSPVSFHGRFNPRSQSISITPGGFQMPQQLPSPGGFSPQAMLLQHGLARGGSPSLANLSSMMSPTSPFSPEGFTPPLHQRNMSLQYPMLPHQFQPPARASPRLQEVIREEDEEAPGKSPSKTPEPGPTVRHNASDSLQKEIDAAEYHLEEQLREQYEVDEEETPMKAGASEAPSQTTHAREPSVQFAQLAPLQRFRDDTTGSVLHHPRPHSRGHSLANNYFVDKDEVRDSTSEGKLSSKTSFEKANESVEIQTNPSNLGTPVQAMDFGTAAKKHQTSFSMASNPWSDAGSTASRRAPSHSSKASISGLNVQAPEFKFNPTSTFQPGGAFSFGATAPSFTPGVFNAGVAPPDVNPIQFGAPAAPSKINVNAPAFTPTASTFTPSASSFVPGSSDFSFSASGPKFRPDAPAFKPFHSATDSLTTPPLSGSESVGNRGSSIFGNIDLNLPEATKPATKKSKAIPIIRPASREKSQEPKEQFDVDGRAIDDSRYKRAKATADDGDDVPRFAEPTPEPTPIVSSETEAVEHDKDETPVPESKPDEQDDAVADVSMSSTAVSDAADTKALTSPSETSPQTGNINWSPFEFKSSADVADFNIARPFGIDTYKNKGHKKSLSATAKPFVPGASFGQSFTTDTAEDTLDEPEDDEPEVDEPTQQSIEVPEPEETSPVPSAPASPEQTLPAQIARSPSPPAPKRGLAASRFAAATPSPPPVEKRRSLGLSASRFADVVSPPTAEDEHVSAGEENLVSPFDHDPTQDTFDLPESLPPVSAHGTDTENVEREPTFEEIDDIMRHMNENDPALGVNKTVEGPTWHQPSPQRNISIAAVESPLRLPPQNLFRSDAPSPSPGHPRMYNIEPQQPMPSTELEDPFVADPVKDSFAFGPPAHRLRGDDSQAASDWNGEFTDEEQLKLESRANFFDGHVNDVVGDILASRLGPVEKSLGSIQQALAALSGRSPPNRRERRSASAEVQSDADDEDDDEPIARRSMSPRRDRRLEQMRVVVLEALAAERRNAPQSITPPTVVSDPVEKENMASVLKAVEEMREQFGQSLHLDFRAEDLRNVVEEAVKQRMPPTPPPPVVVEGADELSDKYNELQAKFAALEQRLQSEQTKSDAEFSRRSAAEDRIAELEQKIQAGESHIEAEVTQRRAAEDQTAQLGRQLSEAETKIVMNAMNQSAFDQRISDLEDRVKHHEEKNEEEFNARRQAEDRLSEVQRLLRIASEEENRLRESLEESEQKVKVAEETRGKSTMRLALLEAAHTNSGQAQVDLQNRLNAVEAELRESRQEARHWRSEAERVTDLSRLQGGDLAQASDENKHMKALIQTLGIQLQENERIRDSWRAKFVSLQDEMSRATREIHEESARNTKKEQTLIARQEVLDARLQAEAKTRERLESELERLEGGERQGMRAVSECKRLEVLLGELRTENHKLQQNAMRYQSEFEEARESGAREVKRTRESMQSEVDDANHTVNMVREELEDQSARLRSQLDQVKLEADTAKARHEMLLEEIENSKKTDLEALAQKQQNDIEDIQAQYERKIGNITEDAQRAEQNFLERLSISTSKSEHLQDKVAHLEEKLEIAKEAALAAAKAAKSPMSPEPMALQPAASVQAVPVSRHMELPEKISPQALRESIMVLQEQLQEREQRIEELEAILSKVDPDAETKITKRDDEIVWLRELLAVRHSDLHDIITALSRDDHDPNAVKDACIRLKANLQMEEQERERALNGGSAITLPNIAASIQAATPRVAQAVGPLAAAWGNWRKSRDPNAFGSLSGVLSSPAAGNGSGSNSTPSKISPAGSRSSFLSGLLTPPASGMRQTPPSRHDQQRRPSQQQQPTAFSSTGRRFTGERVQTQQPYRPRGPSLAESSRQVDKMPVRGTPPRQASGGYQSQGQRQPVTPPMMSGGAGYDSDAHVEDFDDAAFFDD